MHALISLPSRVHHYTLLIVKYFIPLHFAIAQKKSIPSASLSLYVFNVVFYLSFF